MEKIKNNNFQSMINFILKYGIIIVSIIVGIIGILSIFITAYFNTTFYHPDEKTFFKYSLGIVETIVTIIIISLIALLYKKILKKIPSKILIILLSICAFGLFIFWINTLKLNPETDQKMIHDMAISLLNGNISQFTGIAQYLFLYPYQFGLTFFVSIIYKLFGENYMYIQYVNAICSVLNIILIYQFSKIMFKNENIQKILVILLGGFSLYWMFFNVHFYGNIIGLTLALLSIFFTMLYLDDNKIHNLFLSGIFIGLSILIKSNYNIFLCGILVILILNIIQKWNFKNILIIPVFLFGYFFINLGYSQILKTNNLDLPDGVPMITFAYMGMAEPTNLSPGWYTGDTIKLYTQNNYSPEKTSENTVSLIKNRLNYFFKNPSDFFYYYSQKIGSTWLNPTFQTIWCSLPGTRYRWYPDYAHYLGYHETLLSMVGGNLYKLEEFIFNIYQIIIFIFASIGLFKNSEELDLKKILLPMIFAGGFIFHIIWETKAIYVIQYYFILLPFSAFGINYYIEKIIAFITRKKLLNEKNS